MSVVVSVHGDFCFVGGSVLPGECRHARKESACQHHRRGSSRYVMAGMNRMDGTLLTACETLCRRLLVRFLMISHSLLMHSGVTQSALPRLITRINDYSRCNAWLSAPVSRSVALDRALTSAG